MNDKNIIKKNEIIRHSLKINILIGFVDRVFAFGSAR